MEGLQILHRGKAKALTRRQWRWIKRRQAVEAVIWHLKQSHRLGRCWLKGVQGDALNAIDAAAGDNLGWLMRWIVFLRVWLRAIVQAEEAAGSEKARAASRAADHQPGLVDGLHA